VSGVETWLALHGDALIEFRRDLHRHPELGHHERRTTDLLVAALEKQGLHPQVLSRGTGLTCEVGDGDGPVVGLRADIDALPLQDLKDVEYRSTVPGVCHACGHDVHTAVLLGTGLALASGLATERLPGRVRLIFQPAEEVMPGGALDVIGDGGLKGLTSVYALHCDPSLEVGRIGIKAGPITAAADSVEVCLSGPGGHTSRPHNTVDLVHALAVVATGLPDALGRLVDPRAGMCLVWGHISAGTAANAVPREGVLRGTLRVLDKGAWESAPKLVRRIVEGLVVPYGAVADVTYERGVPPVVNQAASTALMSEAATAALGRGSVVPTVQSLGGEDFAWYLDQVPGAMARLGVRPPGQERPHDLHQGGFDVDEDAVGVGVRALVATALAAMREE